MRIRQVDRYKYKDYLERAEQCANAMKRAYEANEWDACVINAVHCVIAAADALCIFMKGVRHAGERHDDAVALFASVDSKSAEIKKNTQRLSRVLGIKTNAEYGEKLMTQKDAEQVKLQAERFLSFVKSRASPQ